LKPQVPKDVVENFRIIRKLLEHSYSEYKFYDVATLKSVLTFEMALKLQYKKLNTESWGKKPLAKLIDWFQERDYFEVYNDEYLKHIPAIRNILAHPSEHTFSGPNGGPIIENILDLINGLYEDPVLRKQRMLLISRIINELHSFSNGFKCIIDNSAYYAFNAWPAFINNKVDPTEIHFYFNPTFKIPDSSTNWVQPPTIHFTGHSISFLSSGIEIKNENGSILLVTEIHDQNEKTEFDNWRNSYESYCYPGLGYFSQGEKIVDTFSFHLREFHKIQSPV
jgi:hypothetical protein